MIFPSDVWGMALIEAVKLMGLHVENERLKAELSAMEAERDRWRDHAQRAESNAHYWMKRAGSEKEPVIMGVDLAKPDSPPTQAELSPHAAALARTDDEGMVRHPDEFEAAIESKDQTIAMLRRIEALERENAELTASQEWLEQHHGAGKCDQAEVNRLQKLLAEFLPAAHMAAEHNPAGGESGG